MPAKNNCAADLLDTGKLERAGSGAMPKSAGLHANTIVDP
jgi:hypothetical protein